MRPKQTVVPVSSCSIQLLHTRLHREKDWDELSTTVQKHPRDSPFFLSNPMRRLWLFVIFSSGRRLLYRESQRRFVQPTDRRILNDQDDDRIWLWKLLASSNDGWVEPNGWTWWTKEKGESQPHSIPRGKKIRFVSMNLYGPIICCSCWPDWVPNPTEQQESESDGSICRSGRLTFTVLSYRRRRRPITHYSFHSWHSWPAIFPIIPTIPTIKNNL